MFSGSSNFSDLLVQASSFSKPLVWAASFSKLLFQAAGFSNFLRQAASFSSLLVQAAVQPFRCPSLPRKRNRLDVNESSTTVLTQCTRVDSIGKREAVLRGALAIEPLLLTVVPSVIMITAHLHFLHHFLVCF